MYLVSFNLCKNLIFFFIMFRLMSHYGMHASLQPSEASISSRQSQFTGERVITSSLDPLSLRTYSPGLASLIVHGQILFSFCRQALWIIFYMSHQVKLHAFLTISGLVRTVLATPPQQFTCRALVAQCHGISPTIRFSEAPFV